MLFYSYFIFTLDAGTGILCGLLSWTEIDLLMVSFKVFLMVCLMTCELKDVAKFVG